MTWNVPDPRTKVARPLPEQYRPLYDMIWEVMRSQPKVDGGRARVIYHQGIRSAAKRLYAEGWRVQEPPRE